ncbi:MAG: hypothetical protein HUJ72_08400 [Blautia sp.]|nr:hypothetical protein [Blautia sp.]
MDCDKIRQIYESIMQNMETDELYEEMKQDLCNLAEAKICKEILSGDLCLVEDQLRDVLFMAASIGQEDGFIRGFQYAFQLCMECIGDSQNCA